LRHGQYGGECLGIVGEQEALFTGTRPACVQCIHDIDGVAMFRIEKPTPAPALLATFSLLLLPLVSTPSHAQCQGFEYCELVWSDEFDGDSLDTWAKWNIQVGDGSSEGLPSGWGNGELQWYTEQNIAVADGFLTITARAESVEPGFQYTSARIRTRNKAQWTYGRMEMRAKFPEGQGLWPAFWMLPTDPSIYGTWAASGEIDIVENIGREPETIFGTIHYGGAWPNHVFSSTEYTLPSGTFAEDFHVFAVEWEENEIRWYVDDVHYSTKTQWNSTGGPYPAPFDVDFHLLLNLAVGGNLPGPPNFETQFPAHYVIDYVRVYKETDGPSFAINPGLNDAWYNPLTSGQGFLITVFADIQQMFVAWFTYDLERPPEDTPSGIGEPGHRWLIAQGPYSGSTANLTIFVPEGGVFDSPTPEVVIDQAGDGTMTIEFADCTAGMVSYDITSAQQSGEIPIQRIVDDNVALCEQLSGGGTQ
jgi:beta-glucanase (GH16 family)